MQEMLILREYGDTRDACGVSVNGTVLIGLPVTFLVSRFSIVHNEEPVAETQLGLSRTDHGLALNYRLTAGMFGGKWPAL